MKENTQRIIKDANKLIENPAASRAELKTVLAALTAQIKVETPWWVILLKTIAYAIGLILAGLGTGTAAACSGLFY